MKKNQSSKRKLLNTWKKRDTIWAIMATICILIFVIHYSTLFVKAESPDGKLPYIVPNHLSLNSFYSESHNSYIMNNSTVQSYLSDANNYLIVPVDIGAYPQPNGYTDYYFYIYIFKDCTVSSNISDYRNFDYLTNTVTVTSSNYLRVIYQYWERQNTFYGISGQTYTNNNGYQLLGAHNTITYNIGDFTSCYPVYNSTDILDLNNKVIFTSNTEPSFDTGHAVEPENINPIDPEWTPRPQPPQFPNIINHTWPTPPPIDTSTIETLLESIFDILSWFAQNVSDEFDNLLNNLSNFVTFLGDLIKYFVLAILDSISQLANFLYNNFKTLLEPIASAIAYLIEPLNEEEILQSFESTEVYGDFESMTDLVNDSFDVFDNINEPQTFRIPIHLENVSILNCNTQYIDLGWFDSSKTALRAFMWCVTTFGLLYTIIDALPSYISGGDE